MKAETLMSYRFVKGYLSVWFGFFADFVKSVHRHEGIGGNSSVSEWFVC